MTYSVVFASPWLASLIGACLSTIIFRVQIASWVACVAGIRREGKAERRKHEAREDWTREDRSRGRLQGRYCFLHSHLQ